MIKTVTRSGGWMALLCVLLMALPAKADYSQHPEAAAFIEEMVRDHQFDQAQITEWLRAANRQQAILDLISRPAEKTKSWKEYRPIFIQPLRISNGLAFWQEHAEVLARAEKTYGVPPELILAIIGVETNYGRNTGSHRVLDALTTLAFDYPPRAPFFRKELQQFFLLTREQRQDPLALKGSYAGAMGYGQFMPSSYRAYAVDFDGDGLIDIWNNTTDAIGSVANYFARHGWQAGKPVVSRTRFEGDEATIEFNSLQPPSSPLRDWEKRGFNAILPLEATLPVSAVKLEGQHGTEYWLTTHNFYVISRYNRSHLYSMAVYQLSQAIKDQWELNQ
jgi:membrane-bound lytic murein transglycosylase B